MNPPSPPSSLRPLTARATSSGRVPDAERLIWLALREESRRRHDVLGELTFLDPGTAATAITVDGTSSPSRRMS